MIELKVIEKFMEENGLEPYDAFDVDGEFKQCNPLYFNEDLEVRSMELDSRNLDFFGGKACLYRLLTGKDHVKHRRPEDNNSEVVKFKPLNPLNDDWMEWYVKERNIKLCKLYYPPYNFKRTGCKGCPFAIHLQDELEVMEKYLPNERKQCELIWKPIYQEYRRIGYRLKRIEEKRLF